MSLIAISLWQNNDHTKTVPIAKARLLSTLTLDENLNKPVFKTENLQCRQKLNHNQANLEFFPFLHKKLEKTFNY